jgi:acyl-homoserine lactone acylase PvdQ
MAIGELMAAGADARSLELLLGEAAQGADPQTLRGMRSGLLAPPAVGGSNAFAAAASRSASGGALLVGEFHLQIGIIPPVLYIVHIEHGDGDYVQGANLPGLCTLSAARTRHVAWSYTYAHGDNVDVVVGPIDRTRMQRRVETVRIRGTSARERWVYWDGPYGTIEDDGTAPDAPRPCVRWNGAHIGGLDHDGGVGIEWCRNVDEAVETLRQVQLISLHAVVADASGRVGYVQTGLVDQRPEGHSGAYPRAGDPAQPAPDPLPESTRPWFVDPPDGLIVSANERRDGPDGRVSSGPPRPGTHRWCALPEPQYRRKRLGACLETGAPLDLATMLRASYDDTDLGARAAMRVWSRLLPPEARPLAEWAEHDATPGTDEGRTFLTLFHALHHEAVRALFAARFGDAATARMLDHLGLGMAFEQPLDAALLLQRHDLLDEKELRRVLAIAWPLARARAADPRRAQPPTAAFRHTLFGGRLPRVLGFDTAARPWRGGPNAPFQVRSVDFEGERMLFGPAFHLVFDMSRPHGWYNSPGGASESRLGPGYAAGLDAWHEGRLLPLGSPTGAPPAAPLTRAAPTS